MDYITFPFEKFVSCITTEYDVQADSILALYIEIAKYLRDNPIVSGLTVKEIIDKYLEENPPAAGVVSVNGKTGAVTGLYDAENPPPYPVTSVNGKTGAVTGLYDAQNPPPYPVTSVNGKTGNVVIEEGGGSSGVTSVNGKTGAVTGLYDAENPPPYPVSSVNGKTGAVTGLYDDNNQPPYPVTSVNGKTGDVLTAFAPISSIAQTNDYIEYEVPAYTTAALSNIFVNSNASLPAGNTMLSTVLWNTEYYFNECLFLIPKDRIMLQGVYSPNTKGCGLIIKNDTSESAFLNYAANLFVSNPMSSPVKFRVYHFEKGNYNWD